MRAVLASTLLILWLGAAAVPAAAQNRETRPLSGFDLIVLGGGIGLVVRQGDEFEVEVEKVGNLDGIVTDVRDVTLEIRRPRSPLTPLD